MKTLTTPAAISEEQLRAEKKIRVVHVFPHLLPGGAERLVVNLMSHLNRDRFDVTGISLAGPLGTDLEGVIAGSRLPVYYLGKHRGADMRMYRRLHATLDRIRPTILHTHVHVLRYVLPYMLYRRPGVMVHTVHNLAEFEVESRARWLQRLAFSTGTVPVAVADEVAKSLRRVYGIRDSLVVQNCVPVEQYRTPHVGRAQWRAREGFAPDDILFVCVAGLRAQKNHSRLIEAFGRGPARDARARLLLAGDGKERADLEKQVKQLGLETRVAFLSVRSDIPDLLAACDVFVMASKYEGQPLSVMEAMAAGLPVISTPVGGVPELLTNGREGFLTTPDDADALAEAMLRLHDDPALRKTMGMAGAQRARAQFDISRMAAAYGDIYSSLLERSQSRRN